MSGGFHAFALVAAGVPLPDPLPVGLEGAPVVLLPAGKLTAVVQSLSPAYLVRLQESGAGDAARAWLTDRLMEHAQVVEAIAAAAPAFPFGFGVLLNDPAALRAALAPHLDMLAAFLAGADGRHEWCLKFYLREVAPRRGEMALAARSGRDYLAARRALSAQQAARVQAGRRFVEQALARLRPLCEATLCRETGAAPGKGLTLLANVALLVRVSERAMLLAAVAAMVAPALAEDTELTLTGPWPLYSFRPRIVLADPAVATMAG
jgi:hypothetical protein